MTATAREAHPESDLLEDLLDLPARDPLTFAAVADRATLHVAEAAQVLGMSEWALYRAINAGQVPSVRIGRRLLVPVPALRRMLGDLA